MSNSATHAWHKVFRSALQHLWTTTTLKSAYMAWTDELNIVLVYAKTNHFNESKSAPAIRHANFDEYCLFVDLREPKTLQNWKEDTQSIQCIAKERWVPHTYKWTFPNSEWHWPRRSQTTNDATRTVPDSKVSHPISKHCSCWHWVLRVPSSCSYKNISCTQCDFGWPLPLWAHFTKAYIISVEVEIVSNELKYTINFPSRTINYPSIFFGSTATWMVWLMMRCFHTFCDQELKFRSGNVRFSLWRAYSTLGGIFVFL